MKVNFRSSRRITSSLIRISRIVMSSPPPYHRPLTAADRIRRVLDPKVVPHGGKAVSMRLRRTKLIGLSRGNNWKIMLEQSRGDTGKLRPVALMSRNSGTRKVLVCIDQIFQKLKSRSGNMQKNENEMMTTITAPTLNVIFIEKEYRWKENNLMMYDQNLAGNTHVCAKNY